ncbi:type II toxin-antitoxin system RelE/ParE family toxin [archaeon]|jgi:mRNA interferase RelE/StbE|nr:type II toxin-antitoxin system RelE/ParE family toxin [Candidatus Woesearchaeota archaeon]MBT4135611.1 type II toxin-antitoxin system RelE/ParE family toxin [archaeon]MBT4241836.1 type II toxin-antitoxin system RelE/ParE family toxin [archaeon]MBT4418384.1 type II toxin-antitoxin system RelE/ParE family toxin [archaeon]
MLNLRFSKSSARFLKKCDNSIYNRLIKKINELQLNPFPSDAKRVEGRKEKTFRIRIGDYRVLYLLMKENNDLLIVEIKKRQRAY